MQVLFYIFLFYVYVFPKTPPSQRFRLLNYANILYICKTFLHINSLNTCLLNNEKQGELVSHIYAIIHTIEKGDDLYERQNSRGLN